MKVAVLTLCRDRLPYTKHCFQSLRENAGVPYDHYVIDQGSNDGTRQWLEHNIEEFAATVTLASNIGCTRGWNRLIEICDPARYDVVVTFDNDCEVLAPDTLKVVAGLAAEHETILAPKVLGLLYPPPTVGRFLLGDNLVDETTILGNIFMAIPAVFFHRDGYRWDESYAVWDGGEQVTQWHRARGGRCGYVQGYQVGHYLTTLGQVADIPDYFRRRVSEGGRAQ